MYTCSSHRPGLLWVRGGLLLVAVGYFWGRWVTSVCGKGFRAPCGELLRGGLLQGYFHHRLGWVTSLQRHTNTDTDSDPNADALGNTGHFFARAPSFTKALNSESVICRPDGSNMRSYETICSQCIPNMHSYGFTMHSY